MTHRELRILLLDDEPLVMLDLEHAVENAGCVALTATCADEALAVLAREAVDVAILDVSLSRGMTCEPVARRLAGAGIPYILYTSDAAPLCAEVRSLCGELVSKPAPPDAVVVRAMRCAGTAG